jgi:alpha-galactosidase
VDRERFPRGLREVADACHAQGTRFIVWFEPERAAAGRWLTENHPEWVLGGRSGGVVNLGHPDAWRWLLERIDGLLTSEGIDVYRQDHNIDPLAYWQANDAEDRQGITEIGHATGYLKLWDELLRRHPDLLIDSCASGGRRNDLETLRRSVPLLRSDYPLTAFNASGAPGQQCQTYGMSLWIPYHGTGAPFGDRYTMRSSYAPAFRLGWDVRQQDIDHDLLRRTVAEFRQIADLLLGDFYPLTPYGLADDVWLAWQSDRPETGKGCVQAFRRAACPQGSLTVSLRGLEPNATYTVTDLDRQTSQEVKGSSLASGFALEAPEKPAARILVYERRG